MTGKARSTLYAEIKDGRFPAPIKIGKRAVGWTLSSIEAWLRDKIEGSKK
jgi:prophage regulatory protein